MDIFHLTCNNLSEISERVLLSEEQFSSYKVLGYFDGVVYEWSLADGVYTIFMSPEDYQLFVDNKEGNILKQTRFIFQSHHIDFTTAQFEMIDRNY